MFLCGRKGAAEPMTVTIFDNSNGPVQAGYDPPAVYIDPIDDTTRVLPSVLSAAVRNPNLDLVKGNEFHVRGCRHVRGWPNKCFVPVDDPEVFDENGCRLDKCSNSHFEMVKARKFQFYDYERADCVDPDIDLLEIGVSEVERGTPWAMAQELESGVWSRVNWTLQNSAKPLNTEPVSPADAVGMLLEALDARAFADGSVFGPRRVQPVLRKLGSLTSTVGAGGFRLEGLPFGPGITGTGPFVDGDGNPAGPPMAGDPQPGTQLGTPAGAAWLYIVGGRVEYNFDPVRNAGEWVGERLNMSELEALRNGIWRFNPLCSFAVLMCHKEPSCC